MSRTKPGYCPNAVATRYGWVDPKTGEVLVSVKDLPDQVEVTLGRPVVVENKTEVKPPEEPKVEEVTLKVEESPIMPKPSKKTGGK